MIGEKRWSGEEINRRKNRRNFVPGVSLTLRCSGHECKDATLPIVKRLSPKS